MKKPQRWVAKVSLFLGLFMVVGGALWTGVWAAEGALFPGLNELIRGALGFAGALGLLVVGNFVFHKLFGNRRDNVFLLYNDAVRRITEGDFGVKIPLDTQRAGGPWEEFHQLGQNLNTMADTLARMEDLRRQFVADVSHEFQSPLTSILGFAQALRADLPPAMRARYLGIIEDEARRLSRVSANLLKLNSLEDQAGPPDPARFALNAQLRQVIVALEPQWSARGLTVEAEGPPTSVEGNEELWTQAWTNLVHNAIKFTPPGGRITIRVLPGPPAVVDVEDTGIGLTPDQAARVFERFYKVDAARSAGDGAGSGLGLALVQRIATLHGARVEALSPGLGQGTTMRVSFGAEAPRG